MITHHDFNLLVHNLQKLYRKLALLLLGVRKSVFHRSVKNPHDIYKTISSHIDQLAKNPSSKIATQRNDDAVSRSSKDSVQSEKNRNSSEKEHRTVSTEYNPAVKQQLVNNTWLHIQAAIRFARQGKKTEAHLYAHLASSALDELGHYMTEDEYLKFTSAIDLELNRVEL